MTGDGYRDGPETRTELLERAAAYAETVPLDVDTDSIEWSVSDRARRRAGCCLFDGEAVEIRLTWDAYRAAGWRQFTATIRHELIHAWQFQRFGEADHGEQFAAQAARLDAPRHCERFSDARLRLACAREDCGWSADRYRASPPVKEPRAYQCGDCGGALVVVHESGERWRTAAGYQGARERIEEW
ncbi:sprT domain-containing protein [Halapricum sp. CBA1109]|uniref:SprT-like domain-containing protein n=1 Tax=Halapricum sp. CBA1109 TaxID=2668068 RepID=UPI0013BC552C|nr:sprT domain-containing protein [Halapricum sp. CBA1109]